MNHNKWFILVSLMLLVLRCSETTTNTNNPVTPPEKTTATINFIATQNGTSIEANWWVKVLYPSLPEGENWEYWMKGEMQGTFHITIDFNEMNSEHQYPTGDIQYCATLNTSAKNWKSIKVSKGDAIRTEIVTF